MTFAELIDRWDELVGGDIAALAHPVALDFSGRLTLIVHEMARPTPATDLELSALAASIVAGLPDRIDGVRVRRVLWQRRRLSLMRTR
jgi:hypothetical protein